MAEPPLLSWLLNYSGAPGNWHLGQATPPRGPGQAEVLKGDLIQGGLSRPGGLYCY